MGDSLLEPDRLRPSIQRSLPPAQLRLWRIAEIAVLLLGTWAYATTLGSIFETWRSNPDYSHGYFVVPVAFAFLWARRDGRPREWYWPRWEGLILLAFAALLRYSAGRLYLPELDGWSIPFWLGGVVLLFHGARWFRWTLPSMAFLWFATPLPTSIEILLSTPLQHFATEAGSWALRLLGQPAIAEGTTILLNEHVLDIERACSGLRMFYGIFAMAVACVVFSQVRGRVAALILLAAVPIAIAANVFRITLTGLLLQVYPGEFASRFSHDFAGYLMIPLAVLLFALFSLWLFQTVDRLRNDPSAGISWISRWTLAALVVGGVLLGWGHRQNSLMLSALLEKARLHEQTQDWPWASVYYERYLQANPDDPAVFEQYVEVYSRTATNRTEQLRALSLAYRAWKSNATRTDLAEYAARTAFDIGEVGKTLQICESLQQAELSEEARSRTTFLYADVLLKHFRDGSTSTAYSWDDLASALDSTRAFATTEIVYQVELARIWRDKLLKPDRRTRETFAIEVMDQLVLEHSEDPMAWLARYQFSVESGTEEDPSLAEQAEQDLLKAMELVELANPADQTTVYIAAASHAQRDGKSAEAEGLLKLAIKSTPTNPRPYVLLSELKRIGDAENSRQQAVTVLRDALEKVGDEEIDLLLPLASLLTELRNWEGVSETLDLVDQQLPEFSGRTRSKLRLGVAVIRAQLLWEESGPYPSTRLLESIVNDGDVAVHRQLSPKLFARAHVLLGRLYESVGILDRSSEQYRAALQLDPASTSTRAEAIAPVLNSGDLESAELLCRQLLRDVPDSRLALTALIRLETRRQLRLPVASRDWSIAQRALELATDRGVPPSKLLIAEIELLESQGDLAAARSKLDEALEQAPRQAVLWRESAMLLDRLGAMDEALAAAERYTDLLPNELEPVVLKATLLEKANRSEDAEQLLRDLLEQSTGRRWILAAQELARLQLLLGQLDEAKTLLAEVHRKDPANLIALNALADLAWATGNWGALERYEASLFDLEGESGSLWRYHRGQRLLELATSTLDPSFEELSRISHSLQELRPRWSKTSLLRGDIALRVGKIDAAIAAYQRAWTLGDRSALLADRLIELLTEQDREPEAQSYVLQVQNSLALSSQLFDRAMPYYVRQHQATALRLAKAWTARQPTDAKAHLRLGRVHVALSVLSETDSDDHLKQASKSFLRTLELSPQDVGVWLAYVSCARRLQGSEFALEDCLQGLVERLPFADSERELTLAQVYDELEEPLLARSHYRSAVELAKQRDNPADVAKVLAQEAEFYLDFAPAVAELRAHESLALDAKSLLPQRVLIRIQAESVSPKRIEAALQLTADSSQSQSEADTDFLRRERAKALMQRGQPEDLNEAIGLMETLLNQTREDRLLLASLYEKSDRIGPAFETLSRMASDRSAEPRDLAAFLEFWQRHFLAGSVLPDQPDFGAVANAIYDQLKRSPARQAEWLRLKLQEERLIRGEANLNWAWVQPYIDELLKVNRGMESWNPATRLAWCRSIQQTLCRQKLENYAYRFVKESPDTVSGADAAVALCHALILSPEVHDLFDKSPDFFSEIQLAYPQRADLARAIGDYMLMSGRYESAADLYRKALAVDPQSELAKNNLALALAELPGRLQEAKAVLDAAIEEHGSNPILLDTRSVIELINNRPQQALETLEQVLAASSNNAVGFVHTAMAHQQLGDRLRAREYYIDALALGLNETLLSVRDRAFCQEVSQQLEAMVSESDTLAVRNRLRKTN